MAVSIDGAQLAAACQSGAIQVFSVQNGDSLFVLSEHQVCATACVAGKTAKSSAHVVWESSYVPCIFVSLLQVCLSY